MALLPAKIGSGSDPNTPFLTKPMSNSSNSQRVPFVNTSMRPYLSRTTLVNFDESLEQKTDVMYETTTKVTDYSYFDHLLAVFCIPRQPKFGLFRTTVSAGPPEYNDREEYFDSPWVLPVYVLSRERDQHRHLIPKEAKCTIDTGNLQGNIVSRAFLVDVLGYLEADFHKLAKEEEEGGTGITGHTLIPEGAIYLTWYHSNSTKVFRDMRFLISEHPMYDLIIGARSVRENNILDVPNLADSGAGSVRWKTTLEKSPKFQHLKKLEATMNIAKQEWQDFKLDGWKEIRPKPNAQRRTQLVREKEEIFEKHKKAFNDECKAEYRILIWEAEANHDQTKNDDLRQEYSDWFKQTLPKPLPQEEKKKNV